MDISGLAFVVVEATDPHAWQEFGETVVGMTASSVAVGGSTVYRTKRRFVEGNLEAALSEEPGPGAERRLSGKEEALLSHTFLIVSQSACGSRRSSGQDRATRRPAPLSRFYSEDEMFDDVFHIGVDLVAQRHRQIHHHAPVEIG